MIQKKEKDQKINYQTYFQFYVIYQININY